MAEVLAPRLPLSAAYFDPAFINCLSSAIADADLVHQFCRLYGSKLNTPQRTEKDMAAFTGFVHDSIYLRLPDEAIHYARLQQAAKAEAIALAANSRERGHA